MKIFCFCTCDREVCVWQVVLTPRCLPAWTRCPCWLTSTTGSWSAPSAGPSRYSSNHSREHRVITYRGAKPSRLHYNWNLLLTIFGSWHCVCENISWFREEGWKSFCRFVFVFYFIITRIHEQT